VDEIREAIGKDLKRIRRVRVHESGDFYNQEYLDKWFVVAQGYPDLTFYAYTKSFQLDFSKKPDNFVLIGSFDETSSERARGLYQDKKNHFSNTFTIVSKNAGGSCIGDCTKCNKCWTENGHDITVELH
jgi:hypothetical protein